MSAISRVQNSQIWSNKYLLLSTLNPDGGIIGRNLQEDCLHKVEPVFGLLLENSLINKTRNLT